MALFRFITLNGVPHNPDCFLYIHVLCILMCLSVYILRLYLQCEPQPNAYQAYEDVTWSKAKVGTNAVFIRSTIIRTSYPCGGYKHNYIAIPFDGTLFNKLQQTFFGPLVGAWRMQFPQFHVFYPLFICRL